MYYSMTQRLKAFSHEITSINNNSLKLTTVNLMPENPLYCTSSVLLSSQ